MFTLTTGKDRSEFDVQAELYHLLRTEGFEVRGEVYVHCENGTGSRLDLVVFNKEGKPIVIVETKKDGEKKDEKQIAKYKELVKGTDIKVLFCIGMKSIPGVLPIIKKLVGRSITVATFSELSELEGITKEHLYKEIVSFMDTGKCSKRLWRRIMNENDRLSSMGFDCKKVFSKIYEKRKESLNKLHAKQTEELRKKEKTKRKKYEVSAQEV